MGGGIRAMDPPACEIDAAPIAPSAPTIVREALERFYVLQQL